MNRLRLTALAPLMFVLAFVCGSACLMLDLPCSKNLISVVTTSCAATLYGLFVWASCVQMEAFIPRISAVDAQV